MTDGMGEVGNGGISGEGGGVLGGQENKNAQVIHKYRIIGKAGEGTFSEVLKGVHIHSKKYVAIKRMKQKFNSVQQVNNLREVQALRRLNPNSHIIGLKEIIFDRRAGTLSLVCELADQNLYEMIRSRQRPMPEARVCNIMSQLLSALDHTHRVGIYHRDIKPENLLVTGDHLKVADFGSCRSVYSKQPLTEYISTRWYRPPECLLTEGRYGYKMDLWAAGCVMFEITTLRPLFPGTNELDQIHRIHSILGTPNEKLLTKFYQYRNRQIPWEFPERRGSGLERNLSALLSKSAISLLYKLIKYDPEDRATARQALRTDWIKDFKREQQQQRAAAAAAANSSNARESSRDSGVDLDSPSVASNRKTDGDIDGQNRIIKENKLGIGGVGVGLTGSGGNDKIKPIVEKSNSSIQPIPAFKLNKQSFNLRKAIVHNQSQKSMGFKLSQASKFPQISQSNQSHHLKDQVASTKPQPIRVQLPSLNRHKTEKFNAGNHWNKNSTNQKEDQKGSNLEHDKKIFFNRHSHRNEGGNGHHINKHISLNHKVNPNPNHKVNPKGENRNKQNVVNHGAHGSPARHNGLKSGSHFAAMSNSQIQSKAKGHNGGHNTGHNSGHLAPKQTHKSVSQLYPAAAAARNRRIGPIRTKKRLH